MFASADQKLFYMYDTSRNIQAIVKWHSDYLGITTQGAGEADPNHHISQITFSNTSDDLSWYCFEVHIRISTGLFEGRVNGGNVYQSTNSVNYGSASVRFNTIKIMSNAGYVNTSNALGYVDVDDVAFSTTGWIGTLGGEADTISPSVSVATANPSSIVSDALTVTGSASDAVGVSSVKYRVGSAPDASNGTACTGTTSWSCSTSGYASGSNTLYVGAGDAAGNWGASNIVVNYGTPTPTPTPTPPANRLFYEPFDDDDYASRGWYDNTTHGTAETEGCYAGNCLEWAWTSGQQYPANGGAMRRLITPAFDEFLIRFRIKFPSNWVGSGITTHPHMFHIVSDMDSEWTGLAYNYLNMYPEFHSDTSSPYAIKSWIAVQDGQRVNIDHGTPPNEIADDYEDISTVACNGIRTGADAPDTEVCYNISGSYYYSAGIFKNTSFEITKDAWHLVDTYMRANTIVGGIGQPDGVIKQWVDGVLVHDLNNVLMRTGADPDIKWMQVVLAPEMGTTSPATQSMWIDELEIYNSSVQTPTVSGVTMSGISGLGR